MKPATPLPWGTDYSTACYWDVIAGGKQLCTLFDDDGNEANGYRTQSGYSVHQAEQDAAYIAHACNLYPELVRALKAVCHALAAWRDGEDVNLEELKYMIVDRAIECAEPGFDGGTTTADELRANIAEWRARLTQAEGMEDR